MNDKKKKLFLPMYMVAKAGGIERIEKFFDYQCEVVILPDSYNCGVCVEDATMAQGPD